MLTELSPDGKRERKQLSAAFSQPERNSSLTAVRSTGLYCQIPKWRDGSSLWTHRPRALSRRTDSVSSLGGEWCHEIVDVSRESGSWGFWFEWSQRALHRGVERNGAAARPTGGPRVDFYCGAEGKKEQEECSLLSPEHLWSLFKGCLCIWGDNTMTTILFP